MSPALGNDVLGYFICRLAQLSRSPTVRLNTGLSGAELVAWLGIKPLFVWADLFQVAPQLIPVSNNSSVAWHFRDVFLCLSQVPPSSAAISSNKGSRPV